MIGYLRDSSDPFFYISGFQISFLALDTFFKPCFSRILESENGTQGRDRKLEVPPTSDGTLRAQLENHC